MESSNEKMTDKRKVLGKIMREQEVILHGIWKWDVYWLMYLEIKGIWATRVTDGGWRRSALNAAAAMLSTSFNVNVTSDNVKNRIKLWRSGFDWDDTKHMITVENENAWNEYCTVSILSLICCYLLFKVDWI